MYVLEKDAAEANTKPRQWLGNCMGENWGSCQENSLDESTKGEAFSLVTHPERRWLWAFLHGLYCVKVVSF